MGIESAEERRDSIQDQFNGLVTALRAEGSAVADWLEEAQDTLKEIFGANPGAIWGNLTFRYYLWTMLDMIRRMRAENSLPVISREVYNQATHEWNGRNAHDARAWVLREVTRALNTFRHDLYESLEILLEGAPVENDGAKAYCRVAFIKLLHMSRLPR